MKYDCIQRQIGCNGNNLWSGRAYNKHMFAMNISGECANASWNSNRDVWYTKSTRRSRKLSKEKKVYGIKCSLRLLPHRSERNSRCMFTCNICACLPINIYTFGNSAYIQSRKNVYIQHTILVFWELKAIIIRHN